MTRRPGSIVITVPPVIDDIHGGGGRPARLGASRPRDGVDSGECLDKHSQAQRPQDPPPDTCACHAPSCVTGFINVATAAL